MEKLLQKLKVMPAQSILSIAAVALALLDTFLVPISTTALGLLAIAALPWFANTIRSVELPGMRIELQDVARLEQQADQLKLPISDSSTDSEVLFHAATNEPVLALAGLRMDLERRLRTLAEAANIRSDRFMPTSKVISYLQNEEVLSPEAVSLLRDLMPILNRAAHVHSVEQISGAADRTIELGVRVLAFLDEAIQEFQRKNPDAVSK